ncbi:MAG: hypothetical protein U1E23_10485 [Reyranellaceae bacterium]
MRTAGILIAFALSTGVAGCGWPESGAGGLAERDSVSTPSIDAASASLDRLSVAGGEKYAAADMVEARLLLVRAKREQVGGLPSAASSDLARLQATIERIEIRLSRPPAPISPEPQPE